jgi:hypothetical protein
MINKEAQASENTSNFNLKEEIKKLEDSPRRDLQIIGYYLSLKGADLRSKEQLNVAIKRHLRPAGQIAVFEDDQIVRGFRQAMEFMPDSWTIESALKALTK